MVIPFNPHGYIYLVKNKINGKCYIGKTSQTIKKRWAVHVSDKRGGCRYLHNAIKKYGKDNFSVVELDIADSEKELTSKEKFWIKEYSTLVPKGYNLTGGGEGASNPCEETRHKLRESKLGFKNPNFGKPLSDETKRKLSQSLKGRNFSSEHRNKISKALQGDRNGMYGGNFSDTHRERMSSSRKNFLYNTDQGKEIVDKFTQSVSGKNNINRRNPKYRTRALHIHKLRKENPNWSYYKIASEIGCSPSRVREILKGIRFPGIEKELGES